LTRPADAAGASYAGGIAMTGVTVRYRGTVALDAFCLEVAAGSIMALIGPSGCGKTTALRAVAGFVRPDAGRIAIAGRDVTGLPPAARDIGMVVQSYALFPHMSVVENVAFGLRARGQPGPAVRARVAECLALVGMDGFADRLPRQLSGGQQQRVAIARALAIRPQVLLLDEPLSALDAPIRRAMLDELAALHRDLPGLTVLYVTHDQGEALTLASRIAILCGGRKLAEGPSQALYRRPPNRFAAEFLGQANLLEVAVEGRVLGGMATVRLGDTRLKVPDADIAGARALLCLRPHDITLADASAACSAACNLLPAELRMVHWQGERHLLELCVAGQTLRVSLPPLRMPPAPGTSLALRFAPDDATLLPHEPG